MMEYASSPQSSAKTFQMVSYANLSVVKSDILKTLFPSSGGQLEYVQLHDLSLPKTPNRKLTARKLACLATKAHNFVLPCQRAYYPVSATTMKLVDSADGPTAKKAKASGKSSVLPKRVLKLLNTKNTTKTNATPVSVNVPKNDSHARLGNILSFFKKETTPQTSSTITTTVSLKSNKQTNSEGVIVDDYSFGNLVHAPSEVKNSQGEGALPVLMMNTPMNTSTSVCVNVQHSGIQNMIVEERIPMSSNTIPYMQSSSLNQGIRTNLFGKALHTRSDGLKNKGVNAVGDVDEDVEIVALKHLQPKTISLHTSVISRYAPPKK